MSDTAYKLGLYYNEEKKMETNRTEASIQPKHPLLTWKIL